MKYDIIINGYYDRGLTMQACYYISEIVCPICGRKYSDKRKTCECGFTGLKPKYDFDELYFKVFKYAKRVFRGMIEFPPDKLFDYGVNNFCEEDGNEVSRQALYVDQLEGERGIAVLDEDTDMPICAWDGLFALQHFIKAAIVNAEYVHCDINNESSMLILFLGPKFKSFIPGNLNQPGAYKYIEVHKNNPYYSSRGNVLYSKDYTRLCVYPSGRKDEEFTVPEHVKVISTRAFCSPRFLKKLRLPEGIKPDRYAFHGCEKVEIEYYKTEK